jgi:hypothetical protein
VLVTAASGGSLLFDQYAPFAILKPKNLDLNLRSGLGGGCKGRVVVCFGVLPGVSGSRFACRRDAEPEENCKMMAEEGHEGKAPCEQRPALKIKSKKQSLECQARVSQKGMSSRASRIDPRVFRIGDGQAHRRGAQ